MQQLQQISLLGQQVAFYALLLDITAKAAKGEPKCSSRNSLGYSSSNNLKKSQ